jgi:hypothetical protein
MTRNASGLLLIGLASIWAGIVLDVPISIGSGLILCLGGLMGEWVRHRKRQ